MADTGVVSTAISADPLDPDAAATAVARARHGAVVTFAGVVRDLDGGRSVSGLSYEAHPSAVDRLREAAESVAAAHPDVAIAAAHRIGDLAIGDLALSCAVAAPHRAEAFAACAALVDAIKESVPIWKHQRFADGATEWVGAGG